MRLPSAAHTSQPWRIHELAYDYRLEDVWALPARGDEDAFPRLAAAFASLDPFRSASRAVRTLFGIRRKAGELFRLDGPAQDPPARSLRRRLPEEMRQLPAGPRSRVLPYTPLYLTEREWAVQMVNRTVDGVIHLGWVPDGTGAYRGQMAILVKRRGVLGTFYMAAITPFRHAIVYPRLLADIERSWTETPTEQTVLT